MTVSQEPVLIEQVPIAHGWNFFQDDTGDHLGYLTEDGLCPLATVESHSLDRDWLDRIEPDRSSARSLASVTLLPSGPAPTKVIASAELPAGPRRR